MRPELRRWALAVLCLLLPAAHAAPQTAYRDPIDYFFQPFLGDLRAEAVELQAHAVDQVDLRVLQPLAQAFCGLLVVGCKEFPGAGQQSMSQLVSPGQGD